MVRKLDESVKERLRKRAARNGHSMEEEVREILRVAVMAEDDAKDEPGLGTRIAARFAWLDEPFEIPELRGYPARPMPFEEWGASEDDAE